LQAARTADTALTTRSRCETGAAPSHARPIDERGRRRRSRFALSRDETRRGLRASSRQTRDNAAGSGGRGLLLEIDGADADEQQQIMARVTGNYRRGNERLAKNHPHNR